MIVDNNHKSEDSLSMLKLAFIMLGLLSVVTIGIPTAFAQQYETQASIEMTDMLAMSLIKDRAAGVMIDGQGDNFKQAIINIEASIGFPLTYSIQQTMLSGAQDYLITMGVN